MVFLEPTCVYTTLLQKCLRVYYIKMIKTKTRYNAALCWISDLYKQKYKINRCWDLRKGHACQVWI